MATKLFVAAQEFGRTGEQITQNTRVEGVRCNNDFLNTSWVAPINVANTDVPSLCGNWQQGVQEGGESDV